MNLEYQCSYRYIFTSKLWFGFLRFAELVKNSPNIRFAIKINRLPPYGTTPSPSWWVTEFLAEENRLDAVSNDSEITDEKIIPYLGFALTEEDKRNKNFEKSVICCVVQSLLLTKQNKIAHTLQSNSLKG